MSEPEKNPGHKPVWKKRTSKAEVHVAPRAKGFGQQAFIPAMIDGLGVSMKHFFQNVATHKEVATIEYPEEQAYKPERYRGLHRLMHRDDGAVRCVACQCCSTACPAHCITIVAEQTGNANEKRPAIFEIDELRCVVCGLCVEACPCDAIRMDGGIHAPPTERRVDAIYGKADLMKRGTLSAAVQGGTGAEEWRDKPLEPNANKLPADK